MGNSETDQAEGPGGSPYNGLWQGFIGGKRLKRKTKHA